LVFQVADFGGSILLQSTFCVMAKPGTDLELMAYFKPLKPVNLKNSYWFTM